MSENFKKNSSRRAVLTALGSAALTGSIAHKTHADSQTPIGTAPVKVVPSFTSFRSETNLKEGEIIYTLGYYLPGDGGGASYEIVKTSGAVFEEVLPGGLFAKLLTSDQVSYKMFGATGDGKSDDGIAIKNAHLYANQAGIPVVNNLGEFWLKETKRIPVQTNTYWGNTIFHIDESYNKPREPHFEILPDEENREIVLDPDKKASLIQKLKPGIRFIPELEEFKNCLIVVRDEEDRIGRRYGADYNPRGWAREEFFYVEEHGRIIGDIAWSFENYTHLTAYPCGEGYLTVEGGTFLLSGDNPGVLGGPYHQNGISTRRSRTVIRNQWVGLEKGKTDISLTPRSGFYSFSHVYDILLENVRLVPWEKNRKNPDEVLKAGTYGIGGARVLCGTFRNITAEGSPVHWGVFGTNLFKNFRIESCRLNRVDVHFHGWNITIKDSEVGQKGLTLTGGGELIIENTKVFNNVFVNFRSDYGAKWDGPIRIINCRGIPQNQAGASLITMTPGDFDYKYPVVFGHQITVRDFAFVSEPTWNDASYSLIRFPKFSVSKEGGRLVFPQQLEFNNISVLGRERGIQLFELADLSSFYLGERKGGIISGRVQTNSSWHFENLVLDQFVQKPHLKLDRAKSYADNQAIYPAVSFTGCDHLNLQEGDIIATIAVRNSAVSALNLGGKFEGKVLFDNCNFQPQTFPGNDDKFYYIPSKTGVSFCNCEINLPIHQGELSPGHLDRFDFLQINGSVRHNHLNTRLGPDILAYLSEKRVKLNARFIAMLKSHHELED